MDVEENSLRLERKQRYTDTPCRVVALVAASGGIAEDARPHKRASRSLTKTGFFPQTVLALWGSGVFKAGDPMSGFPASRTFPDTENH